MLAFCLLLIRDPPVVMEFPKRLVSGASKGIIVIFARWRHRCVLAAVWNAPKGNSLRDSKADLSMS